MAKSNIRAAGGGRTTLVGPTFFTERVRNMLDGEGARVYREAFRLRSDGQIQTRIIRTRPVDGQPGRPTEHSSGFRNIGAKRPSRTSADLRRVLEDGGYTIVEESWRR